MVANKNQNWCIYNTTHQKKKKHKSLLVSFAKDDQECYQGAKIRQTCMRKWQEAHMQQQA
jgi:hypothetical protein